MKRRRRNNPLSITCSSLVTPEQAKQRSLGWWQVSIINEIQKENPNTAEIEPDFPAPQMQLAENKLPGFAKPDRPCSKNWNWARRWSLKDTNWKEIELPYLFVSSRPHCQTELWYLGSAQFADTFPCFTCWMSIQSAPRTLVFILCSLPFAGYLLWLT